jgi:hypothetical protein
MRATTCVNSGTADLSQATKNSARNACPLRAPREVHLAPDVRQTIFLMRRVFETVLLPHLTDGDAYKGSTGGVQGRDRPVWSDCPWYGNENTYEHYCYCDTNNLGAIWSFHASNSNPNRHGWRKIPVTLIDPQSKRVIACLRKLSQAVVRMRSAAICVDQSGIGALPLD